MGCLIELLGEFFIELILSGYMYVMTLIVPEKMKLKKYRDWVKAVVGLFAIVLFFAFIAGVIMLSEEDPAFETAGIYLVSISGGLILLQILAGILVRTLSGKKKRSKH